MVVFASNDGEVHVYSIAPRSLRASGPASMLHVIRHSNRSTKCVEFTHDGKWLAVGGAACRSDGGYQGKICIYDVKSGFKQCAEDLPKDLEPQNNVVDISFSPCGRYIAWGGYEMPLEIARVLADAGAERVRMERVFGLHFWCASMAWVHSNLQAVTFSPCGFFIAVLTQSE